VDASGALTGSQSLTVTNVPTGTDTRLVIIDGSGRSRVCAPTDAGCSIGAL
jgi:Tfp pilus assembly protein FimT